MRTVTKAVKTFSLDKQVLAAVKRTKGRQSESQRVNSLLRFALGLERRAALSQEAAAFFGSEPGDRRARRAFESAAIASWTRD